MIPSKKSLCSSAVHRLVGTIILNEGTFLILVRFQARLTLQLFHQPTSYLFCFPCLHSFSSSFWLIESHRQISQKKKVVGAPRRESRPLYVPITSDHDDQPVILIDPLRKYETSKSLCCTKWAKVRYKKELQVNSKCCQISSVLWAILIPHSNTGNYLPWTMKAFLKTGTPSYIGITETVKLKSEEIEMTKYNRKIKMEQKVLSPPLSLPSPLSFVRHTHVHV